jgi:RND family efflux transporter MFP subunit
VRKLAFLSVAALLFVAVGCVDREAQKQAARTKSIIEDDTVPVQIITAVSAPLADELEITGEVTTAADVTIGARQAGRVVAVTVRDGDFVRAGQVIAEQETTVLQAAVRQAQSQLNAARSQYSQARSNAVVAPQKSQAAIRSAEAQIRSARAQLAKAKEGARDEEVRQAEAQVKAAKFSMETAKKELERQKSLFESGAVSRQRLEQAENGYQSALSQYEQALENLRMKQAWTRPEDIRTAEEQVRQAEEALRTAQANQKLDVLLEQQMDTAQANVRAAQASLDIAQKNLSDAMIRSPFSGRISGNPVQPGTFLAPGSPVVRVIGEEGIYFEGEVPESQIAAITPGKPVAVTVDALPNRTWAGKVLAVSPVGDEVGRIFRVRIQLAGASSEIKPGMFARGKVTLRSIPNAVTVPANAVVLKDGKPFLFVLDGEKAKQVPVTTGLRTDGRLQVVGIGEGEKVIVEGQNQLSDGAKVRLEDGKRPAAPEAGAPATTESSGV